MFMPSKYQPDYMFLRQVRLQLFFSSASVLLKVLCSSFGLVLAGSTLESPHFYSDSAGVSDHAVAHQVIQVDVHLVPTHGKCSVSPTQS